MSSKGRRGIFYTFLLMIVFALSFGGTYVAITKPFAHANTDKEGMSNAVKPTYQELEKRISQQQEQIEEKNRKISELESQLDKANSTTPKATKKPTS